MRKRSLFICLLSLFLCSLAWGQETDILSRIREANLKSTLRADFTQLRHSSLLAEDLVSSGFVALQAPDKVHWEVQKPVSRISIFSGDVPQGGRARFRLPSEKDFTVSSMESGAELTVLLRPKRRDLSQLFTQIVLKVNPADYTVKSVLLTGADGDWTEISFSRLQTDIPLSPELFQK